MSDVIRDVKRSTIREEHVPHRRTLLSRSAGWSSQLLTISSSHSLLNCVLFSSYY